MKHKLYEQERQLLHKQKELFKTEMLSGLLDTKDKLKINIGKQKGSLYTVAAIGAASFVGYQLVNFAVNFYKNKKNPQSKTAKTEPDSSPFWDTIKEEAASFLVDVLKDKVVDFMSKKR